MLSSLFPRNSVYSNIDSDQPRAPDDDAERRLYEHRSPSVGGIQLPDPFEQEHSSSRSAHTASRSSQPPSPPESSRLGQGDATLQEQAYRDDPEEHEIFQSTHVGSPDKDHHVHDALPSQESLTHHPLPLDHELDATLTEQARTAEDRGPPQSIMYEDRLQAATNPSWEERDAASNMYDGPGTHASQDAVPVPEDPGSESHRSRAIPSGLRESTLDSSQQAPWWLRESRRHLDASSIKNSTPLGPRAQLVASASDNSTTPPAVSAHPTPSSAFSPLARPSSLVDGATSLLIGRGGPIHLQTSLSRRERALWKWVNVEDLDAFLQDVYTFYVRKGMWSIALANLLDLLTIGFVIAFATFLLGCIDYSLVTQRNSLSEVVVPRCVSGFQGTTLLFVLTCTLFYALRIVRFGQVLRNLLDMRDFFAELLGIPEADIQTIAWPAIVDKLAALRNEHPAHPTINHAVHEASVFPPNARLDAHDIANRIMRKENYLIALFNKSVLNLAVPIPFALSRSRIFISLVGLLGIETTTIDAARHPNLKQFSLTKSLEWNLSFCLLGFLFGPDGQVRRAFIQERGKQELVQALQRRFILMACLNAMFAPFIILYLLFYSFFRYFEEYHKNPSSIGSRTYTQFARWKFREFNELPHLFQQRLHRSYPLANTYINQFPNDRTAQIARFVAFIAGSFASVLVLFSLLDPDAFLHFEISKDRSVLFYITLFGTVLAISRGMVPDDHRVAEPEKLMRAVIEETHYLPPEWRGKLHSAEVHREFCQLLPLKATTFIRELTSVLTTPLVLWLTLPRCAPAIVDFFREFTIHVDGLGHVCSFAVFDFQRHGDIRFGAPVQGKRDSISEQGKLEKSVLNFKAANPNWQPHDQATSLYLSRMTEVIAAPSAHQHTRAGGGRSMARSARHQPSPFASPIYEDDDDHAPESTAGIEQQGNRHSYSRRSEGQPYRADLDAVTAEQSRLGESYVSSMKPTIGRQQHGDATLSPMARPSMMSLLYEGSHQKW